MRGEMDMAQDIQSKIVVVGAGTAGLTMAAQLLRKAPYLRGEVTIIDPSENHYYQPFFTLVGGGVATLEESVRKQETLIPEGAELLQEAVTEFSPEENQVKTDKGTILTYEYLLVAAGK